MQKARAAEKKKKSLTRKMQMGLGIHAKFLYNISEKWNEKKEA